MTLYLEQEYKMDTMNTPPGVANRMWDEFRRSENFNFDRLCVLHSVKDNLYLIFTTHSHHPNTVQLLELKCPLPPLPQTVRTISVEAARQVWRSAVQNDFIWID